MPESSTSPRRDTSASEQPPAARATLGATGVLAGGILVSRLLGLLREVIAARQFGTTRAKECFVAAWQVPFGIGNAVARLLTGAMVPVFTSYVSRGKEGEGWRVASTIGALVAVLLAAVWVLGTAGAGPAAVMLVPRFEPESHALTTRLLRIALPYIIIAPLGTLLFCILISYQRFLPAAVAQAAPNVLIVAALLTLAPALGIDALAVGSVLGGLAFTLVQVPSTWRLKGRRPLLGMHVRHEGVKQVGRLCLPLVIPTALGPIVAMARRALASGLQPGSVADLDYANYIVLIPVGILVSATATVVLPKLAHRAARDDVEGMKRLVSIGLRLVVALTVPAMVLAIMLRHSVVRVLYERGQFGPQATSRVAEVLLWSGGLLVTSGFVEVLTRSFHAGQDTLTPSALAVGGSLVRLCLMLALIGPLGIRGLAVAPWLTQTAISAAMAAALRRRVGPMRGREIGRCFLGLAAAGAMMAALLRATTVWVLPAWRGVGGMHEALWLAVQCAVASAVYVLLVLILNPAERRALLNRVSAARG
ncbi:MAG: murein biosynthesis integral membrane protein MurJ [Armatimonadota bacterium]